MDSSIQQRYQALLKDGTLVTDHWQQQAVEQLDQLSVQLRKNTQDKTSWYSNWLPVKHPGDKNLGLYLWGPVGRGKTMLMDLFCESLHTDTIIRRHFHRFMRDVHQQLQTASGQPDPLSYVADHFAQRAQVLCFDEFYVDNIGDAMLLGRLLDHLFQRDVYLVATSNQPPAQLYPDGLHRDRFLPAIALLETRLTCVALSGEHDHRLRQLTPQKSWYTHDQPYPLPQYPHSVQQITLCQRDVPCLFYAATERVAAFNFSQLCCGHRSALDYIELTEHCDQIWLMDVPLFYAERREQIKARGTEDGVQAQSTGERQVRWSAMDDPARRFISLVDELYDRRVNLTVQAASPAEQLYSANGALAFQFQRTLSRLVEMGSLQYQQSPPLIESPGDMRK